MGAVGFIIGGLGGGGLGGLLGVPSGPGELVVIPAAAAAGAGAGWVGGRAAGGAMANGIIVLSNWMASMGSVGGGESCSGGGDLGHHGSFDDPEHLLKKFEKHGEKAGYFDAADYHQGALDFFNKNKQFAKLRDDGAIMIEKLGWTGIYHPNGVPINFWKN